MYHSWTGMFTVAMRTSLIASETMNVLVTVRSRLSATTAATISPFPRQTTVPTGLSKPVLVRYYASSAPRLLLFSESFFIDVGQRYNERGITVTDCMKPRKSHSSKPTSSRVAFLLFLSSKLAKM